MKRVILHIDMDAFFASVEQADNPELKGKPVIIGGSHRGVVSAASYEARDFGVHSAMPMTRARRLCPHGMFIPGRMRRYKEVSRQIMAVLARYCPVLEQASIDEAYADISGTGRIFGQPAALGQLIKEEVRADTGLTCSVGIAPVKFLAKIASDFRKPDGLTVIEEGEVEAFLAVLPVGKIPGVGKRTLPALEELGVRTAGDVLRLPRTFWRDRFGERGLWLHDLARGIDPSEVVPWSEPKSCSAEHTLDEDTLDPEILKKWLLLQSERVGRELRADGYAGRTVTLKIKFDDFTQITRSHSLPEPTDSTMAIFEEAVRLLMAQRLTRKVRLVGVGVSNFGRAMRQLPLCPDQRSEKLKKVDQAVDAVKSRFGDKALTRGSILDLKK